MPTPREHARAYQARVVSHRLSVCSICLQIALLLDCDASNRLAEQASSEGYAESRNVPLGGPRGGLGSALEGSDQLPFKTRAVECGSCRRSALRARAVCVVPLGCSESPRAWAQAREPRGRAARPFEYSDEVAYLTKIHPTPHTSGPN